jgi:23S rRNA (cytosine1962-C5)-methyltransferase
MLPDDIAIFSNRRAAVYEKGSFLGRSSLRKSELTTAYREINGAADGFPGWTVDRYGKWLLVYHNDPQKNPRGPLPSIHDGNTAGVYYLETYPDRGQSMKEIRPRLIEGQAAPDMFPILENGVSYLVSLEKDLSTGIFLDQRPQRAWLTRNCGPDTRILNCFAHTGAFSVAAAAAGASTVSLDLSRKWLDRLPEHFRANGLEFDERHDCIHGDCFEWLVKLAKRGEKYDIVILDPPSSSAGGRKKKRWSMKNDMDELVALASVLVKEGGLLWTTTNSASLAASKFAQLCHKGLSEPVGAGNAYLERIQPMPADFPSIGPQPVKNLVWRL